MKESPVGGALLSQIIRPEGRGTKILSPSFSRVHDLHGSQKVGSIHRKYDGSSERSSEEGAIIGFDDGHWKAGGKAGDAADLPAVGELLGSIEFVEGQRVG